MMSSNDDPSPRVNPDGWGRCKELNSNLRPRATESRSSMKRMVPGTSESPILSPKVGVTENSSWLLRPTVVNDCSRYST